MTRSYKGIPIGHDPEDITLIKDMTSLYDPATVVELGTMWGGLTTALYGSTKLGTTIATFDWEPSRPHKIFSSLARNSPFIFYKRTNLIGSKANGEVTEYLGKPGRTLLYCDNGSKLEEILLYAPFLKSGDMLGVHDWGVEVHTDYLVVNYKFRQAKLLYEYLKQLLKSFDLVGEGRLTRLWIKR